MPSLSTGGLNRDFNPISSQETLIHNQRSSETLEFKQIKGKKEIKLKFKDFLPQNKNISTSSNFDITQRNSSDKKKQKKEDRAHLPFTTHSPESIQSKELNIQ